jgi:hypothetical protein
MAGAPEGQERLSHLSELAVLNEQPFVSRVPVLGPLIARFRTLWNNVSTRWYVRPLTHQQSLFNLALLDELAALRAENEALRNELQSRIGPLQEWLISQDRDQAELRHDLGETAAQVGQLMRQMSLPSRATDAPAASDPGDDSA